MSRHGRFVQMSLKLAVGCGICLLLVLALPLSFWKDAGDVGSAFITLAMAATIAGTVVLRHRDAEPVTEALPGASEA